MPSPGYYLNHCFIVCDRTPPVVGTRHDIVAACSLMHACVLSSCLPLTVLPWLLLCVRPMPSAFFCSYFWRVASLTCDCRTGLYVCYWWCVFKLPSKVLHFRSYSEMFARQRKIFICILISMLVYACIKFLTSYRVKWVNTFLRGVYSLYPQEAFVVPNHRFFSSIF